MSHRIPTLACLLALAPAVRADLIVGRVVDENGAGIPGVDIDVKNLGGGGDPTPLNDGTDANGVFATTIPAGLYRITFSPPPPPAASSLIAELDDVVVVGTKDLGVVALPAAVALSGRVLTQQGFPVAGVNLDVVDGAGNAVDLVGGTTDAFGEFGIAVPAGALEVGFKTAGVVGPTLAPVALSLTVGGDTGLGDVVLEPGFRVEGTVVGPAGFPVANADLDFFDAKTGEKRFTPADNTDAAGGYSVVVAAGEYVFDVCPPFSAGLVGHLTRRFSVGGDLAVTTIALEDGVVLTGTVRGFDGAPVAGADVDAKRADGTEVNLCADNTNAAGVYTVLVPTGTLALEFEPAGYSLPLAAEDLTAVVLGNTVLDVTLPYCGGDVTAPGAPGSGGIVPLLATAGGAPRAGNAGFALTLDGALGGSVAFLVLSAQAQASPREASLLPGFGGSLQDVGAPILHGATLVGGAFGSPGAGSAAFGLPVDAGMVGLTVSARAYVGDAAAAGGLARSNALSIAFCD